MSELRLPDNSPTAPRVRPAAALTVAAIAIVVCAAGGILRPQSFWPAYLVAAVFWIGTSVGSLALGLLHRLPGGRWGWGEGAGRELHACMYAMPLGILAAAPLIFGATWVYPWARPAELAELNHHQQFYLAPQFVLIRTAAMLLIWCLLSLWLQAGYRRSAGDGKPHPRSRRCAISLVAVWLMMSFSSVDLLMSLTPRWASSMFGAMHAMGFVTSGLALAIIVRSRGMIGRTLSRDEIDVTQDLGSLLMAFDLMWAYFAFSEYLIIWSGDLPAEVAWFVDRQHGWGLIGGVAVIVFHFVIPFALLLSRDLKRNPRALAWTAGLLLAAHLGHLSWTVLPAVATTDGLSMLFLLAATAGLGALWALPIERQWPRLPFIPSPVSDRSPIGEKSLDFPVAEARR